jgi:hypothetical protein
VACKRYVPRGLDKQFAVEVNRYHVHETNDGFNRLGNVKFKTRFEHHDRYGGEEQTVPASSYTQRNKHGTMIDISSIHRRWGQDWNLSNAWFAHSLKKSSQGANLCSMTSS